MNYDFLKKSLILSRPYKQLILILIDSVFLIGSVLLAFLIRIGYIFWPNDQLFWIIFGVPFIAIPIFIKFGVYKNITRFFGFNAIWITGKAVIFYALIWSSIVFLYLTSSEFASIQTVPRSVIFLNGLIALVLIIGIRLLGRWLLDNLLDKINSSERLNIMIYGAGSAGRQLSTALSQSKEYNPIAFIDDSTEIYNHSINGLKVYSPDDLHYLINKKDIKEIFLAIPSLTRARRLEIVTYLEPFSVLVKSLPGVSELAQGKYKVDDLQEIDLRDLLGRDSVKPKKKLFELNIFNKVVMVTGAGGSIGSELCRQIVLLKPKKLILYEISEFSLYQIDQELEDIDVFNIEICPIIGSISDKDRALKICDYYGVQTIYHAAAYKHVPLVEYNQSQGVFNNTIGTWTLAEVAIDSNVENFVLISTDKAVRPTNYMGASKRAAEMVLQALATLPHNTCFTMVRFGNVLDSSGSVIPLFRKQIKAGGPVTVTHIDIVRYFMTIPEAVELVIQAGAMAKGGEVFVLDMGEPVRIHDLAEKMINLSGLSVRDENNPDGDIEIQYTGLRPGEKLYEELLVGGKFSLTENKLIMRAEEDMIAWDKLEPMLAEICKKGTYLNTEDLYKLLKKIVPEFETK